MIEAFGDHHSTPNCAFRYIFQNINGKFNNPLQKNTALTPLLKLEPDILGLSETNVMWNNMQRNEYQNVLRHHWPQQKSALSYCIDSELNHNRKHLQGGIAQTIHGRHSGRILEYTEDYLGRWSAQTLALKNNRTVTVISAYRPCSMVIDPTTETVVAQQFKAFKRLNINRHPRVQFIHDLRLFITQQQALGHEILIGLDANLDQPHDVVFQQLITSCGLIDVIATRHGTPTATHTSGHRHDLILCTQYIFDHVIAAGSTHQIDSTQSDHTAVFLDLNQSIFQKNNDPVAASSRGFTSKQKHKFLRFGNVVDTTLRQHATLNALSTLLETAPDNEKQTLCDQIDNIITNVMLREEHRLANQANVITWSPIYAQHRSEYLAARLNHRRFLRSHSFPLQYIDSLKLLSLKCTLKTKKAALKKVEKNAIHNRLAFLLEKIQTAYNNDDQKLLRCLRNIYRSELKRFAFLKLTKLVKGVAPTALDKVTILQEDGSTLEVTTKTEMNKALLERNANHFHQAVETPFAQPPLSHLVPPMESNTIIAEKILSGDISDFTNQSVMLQELLQNLQKLPNIKDSTYEVTDAEFIAGIKSISEGKSSSQSGRHYSMYKALLAFPFTVQVMVKMINFCVKNNIILQRWKKILQVMLCKIPGNFQLDKMRVINLIEADINMFLRLTWGKKFVRNILKYDQFLPEQMGNRPGYQCSSAVLSKVVSFDLIRLLRASATVFNNDAKACYDRIIPFLSLLCCQHFGLPSVAADFLNQFLSQAEYHVRTCYGTSEEFYNNYVQAIFGVLQGSGSAPSIWLAMSLILIRSYKNKFTTTSIPNPTGDILLQKIIDAFVDDSDLWDILPYPVSTDVLLQRLHQRAQYWQSLIFTTGGKLNFNKCFWYLIQWNWDINGIPTMMNPVDLPATLLLTNGNDDTQHVMKRKSPFDTLKTLGVLTSPSGSNADQFQKATMFLQNLIIEINSKKLSQLEASLLIPVYIHSKLRYIMAATMFTKDECDKLDRIFRPHILSKMGINRTTKLDIIHASHLYGGMKIPSCWDLQGSQHLHLLLGHVQLNDMLGKQLLTTMDYTYLHLGLMEPVLTYDFNKVKKYIPSSWIANTWSYLSSLNGTLFSPTLHLKPQREHDVSIMQRAVCNISGIRLQRINAVRLYLQLFYLSDMVTSSGKHISIEYLHPNHTRYRSSTLHWPYQSCPGRTAWKEWRAFIKKFFTSGNHRLFQPLGEWLDVKIRTQHWSHQLDLSTSKVYITTPQSIIVYKLTTRSRFRLQRESIVSSVPPNLLPVTVLGYPHFPRITSTVPLRCTQSTCHLPASTFTQYVRNLPYHERAIIGSLLPLRHWELLNLIDSISSGTYAIGSDGSVKSCQASYATCIQDVNITQIYIQSHAKLLANSSFTAKSYGYLSVLYLLRALLSFFDIHSDDFPVTAFIDNSGLLTRLSYGSESSIKHCQSKGAAVIREILAVENSIPIIFTRLHVKSHVYDNEPNFNNIPTPNLINKRCDIFAEKAYSSNQSPVCTTAILPTTRIYVKYNNIIYTDDIKRKLQYATRDKALREYIQDKHSWSTTQFDSINWEYLGNAFHQCTAKQKKAFMKVTHKKWATNEFKSKMSNRNDHRCLRCSCLHETWNHIFQCPSSHATSYIITIISNIRKFLNTSSASSPFIKTFIHCLTAWSQNQSITFPYDIDAFDDEIFYLIHSAYVQ